MPDQSQGKIGENQMEPESVESKPDLDDPILAALIKRYGFTPQQAIETTLYLQRSKRKKYREKELV